MSGIAIETPVRVEDLWKTYGTTAMLDGGGLGMKISLFRSPSSVPLVH